MTSAEGDGTAGVHGEATASSGVTFGVDGETQSSETGAAGVRGKATTSDSTATYGVKGVSEADADMLSDDYPAGVAGRANGSGRILGVEGRTFGPGATGLYGVAADGSFERNMNDAFPAGVIGVTDYSSETSGANSAAAIEAHATATSGTAHGLLAQTDSPTGYAVYAVGDLYVGGHADVDDVGVSAYRSGSSHQTISSGSTQAVVFDEVVNDDFSGFDTSTGVYTVQADGGYHVDFMVDWYDSFSSGDSIIYVLQINGSRSGGLHADTVVPNNAAPCRGFSKALFGLTSGDTIDVAIFQDSGIGKDIYGSSAEDTYLTIHKVG